MGRQRREPRFDDDRPASEPFERGLSAEDRPAGRSTRGGKPRRKAKGAGSSWFGRLFYWGFVLAVWAVIGLVGVIGYHAMKLPPIDRLAVPKRPPNIAILASDGTLLANRGETGGSNVSIRELPPHLPQAFIAIEDRRFRKHFGIDPLGIGRAFFRNLTGGRLEGGSTLTQQLAKNLFLTQERTASRKVQEAILAVWLERTYAKDQILELYMNRVYFGAGAYGVEAASQRYFGKSARAVSLSEAAVLAGIVQSPSRFAPNRHPERAADRAALVVAAMAREGFVRDQDAKLALAAPARARRQGGAGSVNYAADYIADVIDDFVGSIDQDIVVATTLDANLQRMAERALVEELDAKGAKLQVEQGALVTLSPNGAIRALVGGRNYSESQFNRAIAAKRQPGSAFKPFVYLVAVENGLTPDTPVQDAPINIKGWRPENYTREYFGEVTLQKALAMSLNTPVVRLIQEVGPRSVARTAQRLGISSPLQANASLALGTSEVTPLEITAAYAAFANGGTAVIPHVILQVKSAGGQVLYQRKPMDLGRAIEPAHVAMMNQMLRETLVSGTARKAELPGWPAAGKTGTTQDHRDAWFVGYTGHLVTTVWVGNDEGDAMRKVTGSGLPAEIWSRYMRESHQGLAVVGLPGLGWRNTAPPAQQRPAGETPVAQNSRSPRAAPEAPVLDGNDSQNRFLQQQGPTREERSLLQRLIGG
jgi:penicillin-binding protein 1A